MKETGNETKTQVFNVIRLSPNGNRETWALGLFQLAASLFSTMEMFQGR